MPVVLELPGTATTTRQLKFLKAKPRFIARSGMKFIAKIPFLRTCRSVLTQVCAQLSECNVIETIDQPPLRMVETSKKNFKRFLSGWGHIVIVHCIKIGRRGSSAHRNSAFVMILQQWSTMSVTHQKTKLFHWSKQTEHWMQKMQLINDFCNTVWTSIVLLRTTSLA